MSPTQRPRQGGVGQPGPCTGRTHTRWALPGSWLGSRHLEVCRAQSPQKWHHTGQEQTDRSTDFSRLHARDRARCSGKRTQGPRPPGPPPSTPDATHGSKATKERPQHSPIVCSPSLRGHGTRVTRVFRARPDSGVCRGPAPGCVRGGPRWRGGHRRHSSTVRAPSPEALQM